ncbi:azurin [Zestomonas thermotolerans]|uniref:azurin n=1 Tax=Zestomonas thermotolerans TaxID=157784 RepID=UPI000372EB71|nr:azurin [Pseudomonas thermotolerans]MBO2509931.1 azurin [Gammaproteobacteria bacterium]
MFRKLVVASALALASVSAFAADCAVTVNSTDQMTFDTQDVKISKSCKSFTVELVHTGKLPKAVMGHNWVLTKTADMQPVATDGMKAGEANHYLQPDDARVIAHTKLVGGGEKDSVTFDVSKLSADEQYSFFCSFPGHIAMMKGTVTLVD